MSSVRCVFLTAAILFALPIRAGEDPGAGAAPPAWKGRVELKRENTDRGTDGEKTKTTFRMEAYPDEGLITLVRLDLPFPDAQTDFEGSAFDPQLGDVKARVGFAPFALGAFRLATHLEVALPTANPEDAGSGKVQVTGGLRTTFALPVALADHHRAVFSPLLEQVVSVAGDPARKDVNYTKVELTLRDLWDRNWVKLTLKPIADWEQDGKTGAVAEVEVGLGFAQRWVTWLMLGHRLWGEGVAGTYGTRVTLGVARMF